MVLYLLIPLWVASAREQASRPPVGSLAAEVSRLEAVKQQEEHFRLLGRFERLKQNEDAARAHEREADRLKKQRIKAADEAYKNLKQMPEASSKPQTQDAWFKQYVGQMHEAKRAHQLGQQAKARAEDHELQARFHQLKDEHDKAAQRRGLAAASHLQADQHFGNVRVMVQRFTAMRDKGPPALVLKPSPAPSPRSSAPEPKSFLKRLKRAFLPKTT